MLHNLGTKPRIDAASLNSPPIPNANHVGLGHRRPPGKCNDKCFGLLHMHRRLVFDFEGLLNGIARFFGIAEEHPGIWSDAAHRS
jgi:hypothetical protein